MIPSAPPPDAPVSWTLTWKSAGRAPLPKAEICPLQYGKRWAYAVEIDDGPISTLTVSQPLLAGYSFTDAPPGVRGGAPQPFVGGAAVIALRMGTPNDTFLSAEQIRQLKTKGWSLLSHSYWHSGNGWEPKGALTAAQFRDELFWSQTIFASLVGNGRAPIHLVLPSGYTAYAGYLAPFGLRSASRVAGRPNHLAGLGADFSDMDRNYLDESVWSKSGDALVGFPTVPATGDLIVDFTHGMDTDPVSPNRLRWKARLQSVAGRFGQTGDDTVWCAPTDAVVAYRLAARAAKVESQPGKVTLHVPAGLPGSRLTLHLSGIPTTAPLTARPGETLYRRGTEVWVTTPLLGLPGAPAPLPHLRCVYRGPAKTVTLAAPERIAGVRLLQHGTPRTGFTLGLTLVAPDNSLTPLFLPNPGTNWGAWLLYPLVPNRAPMRTRTVRLNEDPSLKQMEVWAVRE